MISPPQGVIVDLRHQGEIAFPAGITVQRQVDHRVDERGYGTFPRWTAPFIGQHRHAANRGRAKDQRAARERSNTPSNKLDLFLK